MSGKRSRSFKCAVHHRDREVSSENDFHLIIVEPPLFTRMVQIIAEEFLTDERDRKYYADHYTCCPPPFFIIIITLVELGFFTYYSISTGELNPAGPVPIDSIFIYRPDKRTEVWRFLLYMMLHAGWLHLGFNLTVQLLVGLPLEMVHGSLRIGTVYMAGVLAGSLGTSVFDTDVYLVGASGGVYALLAAHLANVMLNYHNMQCGILRLLGVFAIASCDVGYAIYTRYSDHPTPAVSYIAHLTGALAGLTIGLLVLKNFEQRLHEQLLWWVALGVYAACTIFAVLFNVLNPSTEEKLQEGVSAQYVLSRLNMFRRFFNSIIESSINVEPIYLSSQNPFHLPELEHLGWLSSYTPCFPVKSNSIKIIREPEIFYKTLVKRSQNARKRITLASLYLGTGHLEKNFVNAIKNNDNFTKGNLKLKILLDYTRGSRYEINSRTMLLPLLNSQQNCDICLYHTPFLRGIKKKFTPQRFNEIFGLQHMKLYIFDDYLIISGANLSNDYFTNRQDRYIEIKDKNLADFYDGLVSKVQQFSLKLNENNTVGLNKNWKLSPYESSKYQFTEKAGTLIKNYIQDSKVESQNYDRKNADTWVFPLIQMGQLGIVQDSLVTEKLLSTAPQSTKLFIATGYFNLTSQYSTTIVNSVAECNVLMAHPNANGFQGAKGLAGGVPAAYSLIAHNFHKTLAREGQDNRIRLQEYLRDGWTYHAKGLWYYPAGSTKPCLTLIGSPNFGERSVKKDLETQLAIVTENDELREQLDQECKFLYQQGLPANVNRNVPKWVYAMVFLFKGYF